LMAVFSPVQNFIVIILWATIFVLSFYLFLAPMLFYWAIATVGMGMSVYVFMKIKDEMVRLLAPSLIAFACLMLLLNTHIFPYMFSFQAVPKAARYFTEHAGTNEKLYNYKYGQYELFFYSEPQATQLKSEENLKEIVQKKGNWIFTDEEGMADIEKLHMQPDTIIEYSHLYLNRGGKFINPKTRDKVLKPMYLLKF